MPLPDGGPHRSAPHGHAGNPDLLTARLHITITAEAPLLLRGFGTDKKPALPMRPNPDGRGDDVAMLPGSGLHGAVRSLHETLTGSCLRVFDDEFVPCYRQQADGRQVSRLRLAVVTASGGTDGDGRQTAPTVRLCERVGDARQFRLDQDVLVERHATHVLRSGDRLDVVLPKSDKERVQLKEWKDDGEWVVVISDLGPRKKEKGASAKANPYRAAVRKLGDVETKIPGDVWAEFLKVVDTADDLRKERLRECPESERWAEVVHEYEPERGPARTLHVGLRRLTRRTVEDGQPLWVLLDDRGEIEQVRMAQIWRERGAGAAGDRVGAYLPCANPDELCPACRLFGSADVSGPADGATDQRSYRGHVRFSDAIATGPVTPRDVQLPPMGAPKPGAGQFYLQNPPTVAGNADKDTPLRQWGSRADRPQPRAVRGRKFYWHTVPEPGALPRRGVAIAEQADTTMSAKAVLFPAGTVFRATVTAVDVDREQLGALLAALDPRAVLGRPDVLVHLGGGRPLGYGSCRIEIDATSTAWTSAARYGAAASPPDLLDQARAAFSTLGGRYGRTWTALAKVLSRDVVARETVAYPPGELVGDDEPFEFWKQSAGKELERREGDPRRYGHPLTVLPAAADRSQAMNGVRKATAVELATQALLPGQQAAPVKKPKGRGR